MSDAAASRLPLLLLVLVMLLATCARRDATTRTGEIKLINGETYPVYVWHDDARGVTCWRIYSGFSCLPDYQLTIDAGEAP